jgi:hypothetical protein
MDLKIELDFTSDNYRYIVVDERNRWIKTYRTYKEAEEYINNERGKIFTNNQEYGKF